MYTSDTHITHLPSKYHIVSKEELKMKYVVIDVDAGSDDALALMLLIAKEQKKYKIVGITCCFGNTTLNYVHRNVFHVLKSIHRQDIPVYKGAAASLLGKAENADKFHGVDGFGDQNFADPTIIIQEENALSAIRRLAQQHPGLTFISVGPLTNLAVAVRSHPELSEMLGELWIMGGNSRAIGNVKDTTAEFNFHQDPEAAQIVLSSYRCPIIMLPWEPCIHCPYSLEWRLKKLGAATTEHMKLLNRVDEVLYKNSSCWNPCDALLAAAFIDPQVIQSSRRVFMTVELCGSYTRGQCVILDKPVTNVQVIEQIDFELIRNMFLDLALFDFKS